MDDRSGKPVVCPQREAQQDVIGDDETESVKIKIKFVIRIKIILELFCTFVWSSSGKRGRP